MSGEITSVLEGRIGWAIECGDALSVLRAMPAESVHCVVTSPPYYGLRNYNVPGQLGLERDPHEYIANMVEVFREVRRVLRSDGTCWVNLGDSYAGSWGNYAPGGIKNKQRPQTEKGKRWERKAYSDTTMLPPTANVPGLKPKDLLMMPARLAIALQADGFYLRSDIIWCKRAPMPESVTDRPTSAHEHIFLLSKAQRYYYDADAVREAIAPPTGGRQRKVLAGDLSGSRPPRGEVVGRPHLDDKPYDPAGRNMWNYITHPWTEEDDAWLLGPEPYPNAHFATFPTEIPRRCILAGTSERGVCSVCGAPWRRVVERDKPPVEVFANSEEVSDDLVRRGFPTNGRPSGSGQKYQNWLNEHPPTTTGWQPTCAHTDAPTVPAVVLDPFGGAATTVMVALRLGRRAVAIELNPRYVEMGRRRVIDDAPMFNTMMPSQELTA